MVLVSSPRQFVAVIGESKFGAYNDRDQPYSMHLLTRESKVVDVPSCRTGTVKSLSRTHAKVEYEDQPGKTELTLLIRLCPWTEKWESGQDMGCLAQSAQIFEQTPRSSASVTEPLTKLKTVPFDCSDKARFLSFLKQKYRTLFLGWKALYDIVSSRKPYLLYNTFSLAVHKIGFDGNIKTVWDALECDDKVRFAEIDPEGDKAWKTFVNIISMAEPLFYYIEDVWKLFDYDNSRFCSMEYFQDVCEQALYWADTRAVARLFKMVTHDRMTIEDLGLLLDYPSEIIKAKGVKKLQHRLLGKELAAAFRSFLLQKYRNFFRAWHVGIDKRGLADLSFEEFAQACRNMGFRKQLALLFEYLDVDKSGLLTLSEIAPEAYATMKRLGENLKEHGYVYAEDVFTAMDVNKNQSVVLTEFTNFLAKIGYSGTEAATLFQYLDDKEEGQLSLDGFARIGLPFRSHDSENLTYRKRVLQNKSNPALELDRFRDFLIGKFSNSVKAWTAFCGPKKKKLGFEHFCRMARHLGYMGGLKIIWAILDLEQRGYLTLKTFAPMEYSQIEDLAETIPAMFPSLETWWCRCLDPDRNMRVDIEQFSDSLGALRIKNPEQIFDYFDMEGKGYLTINNFAILDLPRMSIRSALAARHIITPDQAHATFLQRLRAIYGEKQGSNLMSMWRQIFVRDIPIEEHLSCHISAKVFGKYARQIIKVKELYPLWIFYLGREDQFGNSISNNSPGITAKLMDPVGYEEMITLGEEIAGRYPTTRDCYTAISQHICGTEKKDWMAAFEELKIKSGTEYVLDALAAGKTTLIRDDLSCLKQFHGEL